MPSQVSYGMSVMVINIKIGHVITALHCRFVSSWRKDLNYLSYTWQEMIEMKIYFYFMFPAIENKNIFLFYVSRNRFSTTMVNPSRGVTCMDMLGPNLVIPVPVNALAVIDHQQAHSVKNGCVISTVATDALVLKHQAISIHNAE